MKGDIANGTGVTLVLKAPLGFEFNTSAPPNVTFTAGRDITAASPIFSNSTTLTITMNVSGTAGVDTLIIGNTNGVQVRPTAGTPLASGQIFRPPLASGGGTASINGITTSANPNGSGGSNFGTLSEVVGVAAKLTFATDPGGATTGSIFGTQPVIKTQDQFGALSVTGLGSSLNVSLALTTGPGTLLGTTTMDIGTAAGNGTITYNNLEIDVAGANDQLTASAAGLANGLSGVFAVNGRPTISSIPNLTTNEDNVITNAFTIGDVETPAASLVLTATSSNTTLVPIPNIVFGGSGTARTVAITPVATLSGVSMITISVSDGTASSSTSFLLTINSVNDQPSMNVLTNWTILEDATAQTVNLSGISAGPSNESTQTLSITATSSNPAIIPNPTVNYSSPAATGTLSFTPIATQNGVVTISVVLKDNGGTANGGIDSVTNSFTVTVQAVNDTPTLDPISDVVVTVNPGQQTINLTGISAGPINENGQTVTITATSGNTGVIPNPTVTYTSLNPTGNLKFTPVTNSSGTATITVTAKDNAGTSNGGQDTVIRQFNVTVNPLSDLAISQAAIPNPAFFGGTITFKSTVTNLGPTTATGIQVTNILPAGIGTVSVTSSQGTSTNYGSVVVCSLGSLTNGGSATLNVTVEPLTQGTYTNFASVSGAVPDPNAANNVSTAIDAVVPPQFAITGGSLIAESCANGGIDPAERVTMSFALQNNGTSNTTNLVATLKVSGGVTAPGAPQTYGVLVAGGAAVSRSFAFTPIGSCGSNFTVTLLLQDGATSLGAASRTFIFGQFVNHTTSIPNTNFISIPSSGTATPYPSTIDVSGLNTNILKLTITLNQFTHTQPDDLDILLVGPNGQKSLLMSDCGGINTINNIILTFDDTAPSGLPDSSQILSGNFQTTDFQSGDIFPSPAPSGPYVADLSVFNGTNPNGTWQLYVLDDTAGFSGNIAGGWSLNFTTLEPACCIDSSSVDAAITMTAPPDPIVVGNNLTFTIIATNQGPASASGLIISNPLPVNASFVSASASQGTFINNGNSVVYSVGTLANGGSASFTVTLQPSQPGVFSNSATIFSTQADRDLGNNTASASGLVNVPQVTIDDVTVVEGNSGTTTNALFTLQLSSPSSQIITVGYVTTDITATAGSDYRLTNGSVIFNPGQTTKTIMVTVLGDNLSESTEFYGVVLTNLVNVTAGVSQGLGTITDDDPLPSLSISDGSISEGNSGTNNMQFTVTISPLSGQLVSFNFATTNGSAQAGSDYVASSGTVFVNAGQGSAIVSVPIIGDTINETNETFFVNLSGVVNATFSRAQAVGTIINDDFLATVGSAGTTLITESCGPTNGVIDPNETVTVNFALRNISAGTASTTNLVATLLQVGGITSPGAAQTYGALTSGGASVSRPFTFVANGVCGDTLMAVLQLQDGANNLGTVTNFLPMGKTGLATNNFSNLASVPIPDFGTATPYPSPISVSGLGNVTRATVTLFNLSHTYPADLEMLLVGPGGQSILLMSDAGGGLPISNVTLTFDDAAGALLPGSTQIFSGTYKPSDFPPDDLMPAPAPVGTYVTNLSVFNGTNPNGIWSLYVADDSGGDAGTLNGGWRLTLTTLAPPICCGADTLADMAVGLGSSAANVLLGSNFTYTINVTNLGPNTASDVVLTDVLPSNVTFGSASSSIGSCSNINGTLICNLGTMLNAARATITIAVTGTLPGYATNTATATSRAADSNPGNSSPSVVTAIVPPGPLASFSGNPSSGTRPLNVTFNDNSLGAITNRFWTFGNGLSTNTTATNFVVKYNSAGTNSVTLTVSGPGGTDSLTQTDYIVVTNPPPQLLVTPASLNFGTLMAGQSSTQGFQVVNSGGLPLTGNVTASLPFAIQGNSSLSLNPGQTGAVLVSFSPATAGSFSNVVVFSSNGGNSSNPVTGNGFIPASLSVTPASINFGTVAVGNATQLSFIATNSGSIPVTNAAVSVSAGAFSILSSGTFQVPGFASTNILVRFTPDSENSFSNAVVVSSEAGNSTNPLTGVGAIVPVANFVGSPTIGLKPVAVTFTDNSTGTITNRFWNFGDGSTTNTTATSFSHIYNNAGTNTVTLTATGPVGTNTLSRPSYISVTNLPPQLVLNPTNLAFAQLIIGQSSTQSFQVINLGGLALTGSVSTTPPFNISGGTPFNIAAGQTGLVSVSYSPNSADSFSNVAVFTSNGGNSTNSLTGTAITPGQLSVIPSSIDFGTVAVGSTGQGSFTLTNTGGAPLTNGTAAPNGGPFAIVSGTPFTLPGFGFTNVVVSFTPTGASSYSNIVIFTANGSSRNNTIKGLGAIIPVADFTASLTSGTKPLTVSFIDNSTGTITNRAWDFGDGSTTNTTAISFTHVYANAGTNSVSLTVTGPVGTNTLMRANYIVATNPPPLLAVSPAALNFGPLTLSQSSTQSFQIVNAGGLTLTGTVSATTPFAVQSGNYSIAPGQTSFVAVSFSPVSAGNFSNAVVFSSNGGSSTNTVTGVGLTPAQLGIVPNSLNFGSVAVGSNAQASFLLTNQGGSTLSNGSASITAGPFSIISGSPFTLAGFGSTNLLIRFTPVTIGDFTNLVTLSTPNNGNITNIVTGTGAGVPVASFTGVPTNGSPPLAVIFTDNSTGTITNRFWNFGDGSTTNTITVQVSHVYSSAGTNGVSLGVSGPVGSNFLSRTSYIIVTNLPPQLVINPTNLNLGSVVVGGNNLQNLQLSNAGQLTLTGSVSVGPPFAILSGSPYNLPPGQTGLVTVSFSPSTVGNFSNAAVFISNGGNSTNGVIGSGFTAAQLAVSPPLIDFGTVAVGSNAQASFTLTNSGSVTLTNGTINLGSGQFSLLSPSSFTIAGFATTNVVARFTPAGSGSFTNAITFLSEGGNSTNQLIGTGAVLPVANFLGSPSMGLNPLVVSFTDNSTGTITNRLWDFGDGSTSNSSVVTLSHTYTTSGTNDVKLTVKGPVGTNTLIRSSYVVVTNLPPQLTLSPTNVDFGAVIVGQTNTTNVRIINPGGTTLNGSVSVGAQFLIQSGSPYSVAPGQTGLVAISFSPTNAGNVASALIFLSNGGNSTNSVVGSGAFVPAADFIGIPTNGSPPLTVVFNDNSTGTITNRIWDFGDGSTTNTTDLQVAHVYASAGTNNVTLGVSGPVGSNFLSRSGYIVVTNLPPQLVINPTNLDFGGVLLAETNSRSFQIMNTGQLLLSGSVSVDLPFSIQGDTNYNVNPGQTSVVAVSFTPTNAAVFSNLVVFISNGGNSSNAVAGVGVIPPRMGVSPSTLDFGTVDVDIGQVAQASFVVTNRRPEGITNATASIDGGPFAIISPIHFDVPGLSSTNLLVTFSPITAGSFSNVMVVTTDVDSSTNSLTGVGATEPNASFTGVPTIGLKPLSVSFSDNSTGTISNRFWDFGDGTSTNTFSSTVNHVYALAGTNTVTLMVTGPVGSNTLSRSSYITVTNLPPKLVLGPNSLNFGTLVAGTTNNQSFQVTNAGGVTLTGAVATVQPFGIPSGGVFSLAPGQSGTVLVSFGPVSAGAYSNAVVFASNGGNSINTVTGNALPPPQLVVTPQILDFGTAAVGNNVQSSFVATNIGGGAITNVAISINNGPFTIQSSTSFNLPAFGSTNVTINFNPISVGAFSNVLTFLASNGPNQTNFVTGIGAQIPIAAFTGNPTSGLKPLTVNFTDNSTGTITNRFWTFGDGSTSNTTATSVSHVYASASTNTVGLTVSGPVGTNSLSRVSYIAVSNPPPLLALSPPTSDFGTVIVGQSASRSVQIANLGGVTLSGTVSASLPYAIQSGSPYNIPSGQTGQVTIVFSPTQAGSFSNVVVFQSNGGNGTNSLFGIAVTAGQLAVVPGSFDFGLVDITAGTNAIGSLTITNLGGAPITNGSASISPGAFSIVSGTPFVLPGFGSTNLVLAFAPTNSGSFSNAVLFSSSGGASATSLTGAGAFEPVAAFTADPTNGLKPLSVVFTDLSLGTLTNRNWFFGDGAFTNTSASSVSHVYAEAGSYSVSLSASGPLGNSSVSIFDYILVTNSPPNLVVNPGNLNFGQVTISQTNALGFQVINTGGLTLNGTATASAPFAVQSGASYSLASGQTGLVVVSFAPTNPGNFSNNVVFTSNGGNLSRPAIGTGLTQPQLAASPSRLDFGPLVVGTHSEATLVLTNSGDAPVTNGAAAVSSGQPGFTILSASAFMLPGHSSTNLVISFAPASAGNVSNVVVVTSDGGGGLYPLTGSGAFIPVANFAASPTNGVKPLTVTFTDNSTGTITNRFWDFGDGIITNTGAISLTHTYVNASTNTVSLTVTGPVGTNTQARVNLVSVTNPPPQLVVNPGNLSFGSVVIGQSRTQNLQVINTGGLILAGSVTANAPFAIVSGTPYNVPPGQTGLVSVSFSPGAAATFADVIVFLSNGGNSSNSVSGIGLTPPQLAVSPGSINFGTIAVGGNSQANFVLTNMGGGTLSNGLATISAGAFTILSGTPFSLPGFSSTNLVMRFAPASAANFSNVVVITSGNDGSSTNAVVGTGAVVPAANFVGAPTQGLKPLTVTFTDSSTGTITNRFWNFGDGSTSNASGTVVSHIYSNAGTNTVSLIVTGPVGTNTRTRNNYISVTNLPPQLVLNPTNLNFGTLILGQASTQTVQVINTGGLTLNGTVSAASPFAVQSGASYSVPAGQTGQVAISFIPVSAGTFSNAVVFLSNGGNRTNSAAGISVTPPQLAVSPGSINFGIVAVGSSAQANFVLTNLGGAPLTNGVAVLNDGGFSILSGTPFILPGFGSTNLVVSFAPGNSGNFSNVVVLTSGNDGGSTNSVFGTGAVVPRANFVGSPTIGLNPLTVNFTDNSTGTITGRFWDFGDGTTSNTTLTGVSHTYTTAGTNTVSLTVSGPVGNNGVVLGNYIVVTNFPPQLVLSATNLNFGSVIVGQTSTQTVQVINSGGLTLSGSASATSPFAIAGGSPYSVPPGQTGQVAISFSPANAGVSSDAIVFASNGGNSATPVTGIGLTAPQLAVSPASINFGTVAVGVSTQASFVISNLGGAPLSNGLASINPGAFNILTGTPFTLPGFGSTNVVVRFAPGSAANFSNVVVITSESAGASTNTVLGTGAVVPIANFVGSPRAGLKPLTVTFTDISSGTITSRFWDFGDGTTSNATASSVSHIYSGAGTYNVSLTVSGPVGNNGLLLGNYIAVTNVPPQLQATPATLDFGQLMINQSSTQAFQIVNTGGLTLNGSVSVTSPFMIQNGSTYSLAPGETGVVSVVFSPVTGGTFSNAAIFLSNGGNQSYATTGIGLTPAQLAVSPGTLDFGLISAGSSVQANFLLTNLGSAPISGGTASVVGGPFAIVSGTNFSIPGLSFTNVRVRFNPAKAGSFSNAVVFTTANDGGSTNSVLGVSTFSPVADFTASPTSGSKPLVVTFTDRSSGSITNWFWDFGDGTTSNSLSGGVSHTYGISGTYTVSLGLAGPLGSDMRTRTNLVIVTDGLLITSVRPIGPDVQIKFNSKAGEFYRIEYSDSLSPPDWKTAISVVPGNDDTVTSIHVDGAGRPSRFYRVAKLTNADLLPVANFTANPIFGRTPLTTTFIDTSAGYVTNRFWDFGDGSTTNTTASIVSHTYTSAGARTVSLTASGPFGDSNLTRPNYIVATDLLVITSIQNSGTNVVIRFTSSAGAFYRVEYTDGLVSPVWKTAVDLVPGTGNIVTSIHIGGLSQSSRFYRIHLLSLEEVSPSADFNADITFGLAPLQVNFVDTSGGYITNRFWNFGDGATTNTSLPTVSHTYTSLGSNTVGLTVTGPSGASTTIRTNLIIVTRQVLINGIQLSGVNVTISFSSESGRSYRIEYTDDLNLPWNIAVDAVPGTGGIVSAVQVGGGSSPARFFRIRQL